MSDQAVDDAVTEVSVPRVPLSRTEAVRRMQAVRESQDQPETPEAVSEPEEAEDQPETESSEEGSEEEVAEAAEAVEGEEPEAEDADAQDAPEDQSPEEMTAEEQRDGYMRLQDYTKKTQELAERERQFNDAASAVVSDWQQRLSNFDDLTQRLQSEVNARGPEYWAKLAEDDPLNYATERAAHDQRVGLLKEATEKRNQEQQRAIGAYKADQDLRLKGQWPEIFDPVEGPKIKQAEAAYLKARGFSDQEIAMLDGPMDHRQRLIVRDAMKAYALETAKPVAEKKGKPVKVIKSKGAQKADRKTEGVVAARKNLRKAIKGGNTRSQLAAGVDLLRAKRGRSSGTTGRYT